MTITDDGTIIPETSAEIVFYGWEVYRRSQQVPMPAQGTGDVFTAQRRLFGEVAPYACGDIGIRLANLAKIQVLTASLVAAIGEHCGNHAAAFASGQDRSVAA